MNLRVCLELLLNQIEMMCLGAGSFSVAYYPLVLSHRRVTGSVGAARVCVRPQKSNKFFLPLKTSRANLKIHTSNQVSSTQLPSQRAEQIQFRLTEREHKAWWEDVSVFTCLTKTHHSLETQRPHPDQTNPGSVCDVLHPWVRNRKTAGAKLLRILCFGLEVITGPVLATSS